MHVKGGNSVIYAVKILFLISTDVMLWIFPTTVIYVSMRKVLLMKSNEVLYVLLCNDEHWLFLELKDIKANMKKFILSI